MGKKSRSKNTSRFPKRNKHAKAAINGWKARKCRIENNSTLLLPNPDTEVWYESFIGFAFGCDNDYVLFFSINTLAPKTGTIRESSQLFSNSNSDVYDPS